MKTFNNIKYPQIAKNVTIMLEDKNFYSHHGVDWGSTFQAFKKNIRARKKLYGGSTITQQLAKNLYLNGEKKYLRKIKELFLAKKLEKQYSKDEILEIYLDIVDFGGVCGLSNASKEILNKNVEALTFYDSICLISLLQDPEYLDRFKDNNKLHKMMNKALFSLLLNNVMKVDEAAKFVDKKLGESNFEMDRRFTEKFGKEPFKSNKL